jgi:hypothetical protein
MPEPNLLAQVQVGQQFDSLATFKLAMIRWEINSGQEIKINKTNKKRMDVYKHAKCLFHASAWWKPNPEKVCFPSAPFCRREILSAINLISNLAM